MGQSRKQDGAVQKTTWDSPENDMGQSRTWDGTAQQCCVLKSTMFLVPPPHCHRDWLIISSKTSFGFFLFYVSQHIYMQGTWFEKENGRNAFFFVIAQLANTLVHSDKNVESKNVASLCRPGNDLKTQFILDLFTWVYRTKWNLHTSIFIIILFQALHENNTFLYEKRLPWCTRCCLLDNKMEAMCWCKGHHHVLVPGNSTFFNGQSFRAFSYN